MTKEQRRARRDIMAPKRKLKGVEAVRSRRCRCDVAGDYCKKHGRPT